MKNNFKARQSGMTLIELTVVLLVLIGLAGLMIPYVGGFVKKTHDSVNSDELAAVNGAIQRYDVQFMGYPDGMDSLVDDGHTYVAGATAGTEGTGIYNRMIAPKNFKVLGLVKHEAMSLKKVGIDNVYGMNTTGKGSATFSATTGAAVQIRSGTNFASVAKIAHIKFSADAADATAFTDASCAKLFGGKKCKVAKDDGTPLSGTGHEAYYYVAFGIGTDNSMIGRTISEAPVHFAKKGDMNAAKKYNRILAVFQVPTFAYKSTETTAVGKGNEVKSAMEAKFMGTIMPMGMNMGLGSALETAYDDMGD